MAHCAHEPYWIGHAILDKGCPVGHAHALAIICAAAVCACITWHYHGMQVTLATEFLWNWNNREANAAVGYDYILRQCRLRGRIDTDGKVGQIFQCPCASFLHC